MNPRIQEFLLHMAGVVQNGYASPALSEMPNASAKVRLAPLEAASISIARQSRDVPYQSDPSLEWQQQRN